MAAEASTLAKRLQEQQDLNRRAVRAKITGEISPGDFQNFKESTDAEIAGIKVQMETLALEWKPRLNRRMTSLSSGRKPA